MGFMPWDIAGSIIGGAASYFGQQSTNNANRNIARETNAMNMDMNRENNAFNAQQAAAMMAFQERMSSTQYQRAMADMKAAGLNPMMAAMNGGASSPSGAASSASQIAAQTGAPMQNALGPAVASAIDALRTKYEIQNMKETNAKIRSDTALNQEIAKTQRATQRVQSNTAKNLAVKNVIDSSYIPARLKEQSMDSSTADTYMRWINRSAGTGANLVGIVNPLKGLSNDAKQFGSSLLGQYKKFQTYIKSKRSE